MPPSTLEPDRVRDLIQTRDLRTQTVAERGFPRFVTQPTKNRLNSEQNSFRKLPLSVDSNNWIFLAGYFAGGPDEEVTVYRIADRRDSKRRRAGVTVAQITRKHGISAATYYHWKSKYGGAAVSELKRLRELEGENAKLKRMYADLALENTAIKDVLSRKL